MYKYLITFYDLQTWVVEGDSSWHARRKCAEYYPDRFVTIVIQIPEVSSNVSNPF